MLYKLRLLWNFMRGSKSLYTGAIFAVGLATLFSLVIPLVLRVMIDSVIGNEPIHMPGRLISVIQTLGGRSVLTKNLWIGSLLIVALTLLRGLFLFLKGKWSAVASESTARNIRERLYDHLQHLPYDYHVKAKTGDLIQRCTSDLNTIRRFLAVQFIEVGRAIFMVGAVLPIMLILNIQMTLISTAVIPIIFSFAFIFFIKVRRAFQISDEAEGRLSTVLQENLTGVRVVRAFARQTFEIDKFDNINCEFRDLTYRLIWLLAWYWSISDFICLIQIGAVLVLGAYWASKGMISLGTFFVFSSYVWMLLWPVRQMGRILTDLGKTLVSVGRIQEVLTEPIEDKKVSAHKPRISGEVEFRNVSFGYENGKHILKNISFRAKKGQTIAILGPTGSGKSSLVHLLPGLYDYQSGSIKLDGMELKGLDKKWLRQNIGIVLQEPFLFSKTVKDNIALAKKGVEEAEIFEAASIAAVHDVIQGFEKGYETPVGERGVTLSGGQKQRVAIARTLVRDYPILIFDDSLSAVDVETDAAIRKALKERSHKATTFIISHRINTLSEADKILVLENGELVQSGTHNELVRQEGLYRKIWSLQNELEEELEHEIEEEKQLI
ncbi:MAG: ABC transporter ATP-binding protein [Candidatus Cloacimonadota bacterium]|nr:MAG: ABC transporter ATP-binding protein [Candidatus Cloacimonadota bacterium]